MSLVAYADSGSDSEPERETPAGPEDAFAISTLPIAKRARLDGPSTSVNAAPDVLSEVCIACPELYI